ncbi:MAG: thiolase family protein, partial [Planctomycetota bacterium]
MKDVLLAGAARTPIGELNGSLSGVSAVELGKISLTASLERAGISASTIEEVIIGNVLQAGLGQNPARQIAVGCGVPTEVPSFTVNQVCGSGMKAIDLAWKQVASGSSEVLAAGGIENMSKAPYILPTMRAGSKLGDAKALDTVVSDGLTDAFGHYHMGMTAEALADKYHISREEQDIFALESQQKYAKAFEKGKFKEEIT